MTKIKGQSMIMGVIGLTVGLIVLIAVGLPVVKDAIDNQSFTGTLKTVTDNIPILMGVAGLVFVTVLFARR